MNKWLRICLVVMLIGVISLTFGGKGCLDFQNDSGSSVVIPIPPSIVALYELITDTGWWKALSANYQNEGGLQSICIKPAASDNYQNESK